jgi:lysophospholipase L1-like esterase
MENFPLSEENVSISGALSHFTNADGTIKKDLFTPDNIHLSIEGYAVYAERLKPLVD